ncbi:MAG: exosortase/archaeosortase family protein [Nitrospiraceae bacterium]
MEVTLAQELNPREGRNVVKIAAITLLFIITYFPIFADLHAKYSEIDSYYGHGYLIPLVSVFVIWHKRDRLRSMRVVPFPAGLLVLGGGLLLLLFGTWWYVNLVSNFSMLVVLGGLLLYLFGKAITRELLFSLAFLLFMIPLPKLSIIYITFWLKLLAARAATETVYAMGIPVLLRGAFIELPNGLLEIDNACSGLRSLIALTALGVVYAYFQPVSPLKKCIVALTSIPIAMAANLIRIVSLIWVSYLYSPTGRAFEVADFTTGFLIFAIALIGLYLVSKGSMAWERRQMTNSVFR